MVTAFSTWGLVKNSFSDINGEHTRGLFATPRLAYSTSLIIFIYGALGLAYPLFKCVGSDLVLILRTITCKMIATLIDSYIHFSSGFLGTYLALKNASFGNTSLDATYAGYTYQAACGIPGTIFTSDVLAEL